MKTPNQDVIGLEIGPEICSRGGSLTGNQPRVTKDPIIGCHLLPVVFDLCLKLLEELVSLVGCLEETLVEGVEIEVFFFNLLFQDIYGRGSVFVFGRVNRN